MSSIEIKQFKKIIDKGKTSAVIQWNDKRQTIHFTSISLSYGNRTYFLCPCCGEKCLKMYLHNIFKCRKCCPMNAYKGIQNTTKGGDAYIAYKMERFAMKVGIGQFEYPFDYLQHPCPKQKHKDRWNKNIAVLQVLENMRMQSILYNKIWDSKTIRSVESGKNKFIQFSLFDLKKNLYQIESGI